MPLGSGHGSAALRRLPEFRTIAQPQQQLGYPGWNVGENEVEEVVIGAAPTSRRPAVAGVMAADQTGLLRGSDAVEKLDRLRTRTAGYGITVLTPTWGHRPMI
jgi:hypothetical protein